MQQNEISLDMRRKFNDMVTRDRMMFIRTILILIIRIYYKMSFVEC